jgi:hypothetical protein
MHKEMGIIQENGTWTLVGLQKKIHLFQMGLQAKSRS